MIPQRAKPKPVRTPAADPEQFANLLHSIVLAFSRIRTEVTTDNAALRKEWRAARGLATWTEERMEVLEARVDRLEAHAGMPPDPAVEKLRATLANYRPARQGFPEKAPRFP